MLGDDFVDAFGEQIVVVRQRAGVPIALAFSCPDVRDMFTARFAWPEAGVDSIFEGRSLC